MKIENFNPGLIKKNKHIQTFLGNFTQVRLPKTQFQKKVFKLSDGDHLTYRQYDGASKYIVILGHGLTGSNRTTYIKSLASELHRAGHTVIAFNHRNCGEGFGLSKKTYHSGRSQDLGEFLKFLKETFSDKISVAVGFSMSGNVLLKLLGDPSHQSSSQIALPDYAIAINPPINLKKTANLLNQGFNRIYQYAFIKSLRIYTERLFSSGFLKNEYKISEFKMTMSDFDKIFTGPESGYDTSEKYYQQCSAQYFLKNITVPTLIITAKDDPFVDYTDFNETKDNPNVTLSLQEHGGHMGYIANNKLPHGTNRWIDYVIPNMLAQFRVSRHHSECSQELHR